MKLVYGFIFSLCFVYANSLILPIFRRTIAPLGIGPVIIQKPTTPSYLNVDSWLPTPVGRVFQRAGIVLDDTLKAAVSAGVNVLCAVGLRIVPCRDRTDQNAGLLAPVPFQCLGKADVIFVLDSSGSIGSLNYQEALSFLANFAGSFKIGNDDFRFGLVIFSDNARKIFDLSSYNNHPELLEAILKTPYLLGNTFTDKALVMANSLLATTGRPGVPKVVITLTDGNSANAMLTFGAATALKNSGVTMMSIGVGNNILENELVVLAKSPAYVFTTDEYKNLQTLLYVTAQKTCKECNGVVAPIEDDKGIPNNDAPKACKTLADIIFVLDSSGSIGADNYIKMLQFAANITDRFTLGVNDVLFAEIIFGAVVQKMFDFNDNMDATSLKMAILHTPYLKQSTRTDRALNYVINSTMLDPNYSGARLNAKKIVILMTDGASDFPTQTKEAAQKVKERGLSIIAVGIANANMDELKNMASTVDDVFKADTFDDLKKIAEKVTQRTCDKISC
ncbi:collagen alpha-5(VI) chain [Biomphalaria pfeifferi]|uniref:Collagen alpha-5(VI) chain n=1 Tax=Biomphalaria pfeifferi TaxID=112525 RepID=A0AAD8F9S2_BIOPF|nr:collagen alpha-5(VI) chain [Biomphalaria pfeifferi]